MAQLLAAHIRAPTSRRSRRSIDALADLSDPNNVKVACDAGGRALYFSRAPIPWNRDAPTTLTHAPVCGTSASTRTAWRRCAGSRRLPPGRARADRESSNSCARWRTAWRSACALAVERPLADVNTAADLSAPSARCCCGPERRHERDASPDLYIYPVKSCRGIPLQNGARLQPPGLADDRHWMLVRPDWPLRHAARAAAPGADRAPRCDARRLHSTRAGHADRSR